MGIDPVTHKPFSHLITEIATLPPPQAPNLAEAALGCFKDEMLHLLTKRRIDIQLQQFTPSAGDTKDETIETIKFRLSKAIWDAGSFPVSSESGFRYDLGSMGNVEESGSRKDGGSDVFNAADCSLWDLPSDDLINPIV